VECFTSQLEKVLRGASVIDFLQQEAYSDISSDKAVLAMKVERNLQGHGTRKFIIPGCPLKRLLIESLEDFFKRHSWAKAKDSDFKDFNFGFQSRLQGFG
jgi:hypothetical protein